MRIGMKDIRVGFLLAALAGCGAPNGGQATNGIAISDARKPAPKPAPTPPSAPSLPEANVCTSLGAVGDHSEQPTGVGEAALADLNSDGIVDLVVGGALELFSVELGKADGGFGAPIDLDISRAGADDTNHFALGDLNGDGIADLAVAQGYDFSAIQLYFSRGDGHFVTGPQLHGRIDLRSPLHDSLRIAVIGDVNNDGHNDIVAGNDDSVSVFIGDGKGDFGASLDFGGIATDTLALGVNGDGKLDIVGSNACALGKGDGTFGKPVVNSVADLYSSLVIGDFNADGKLDEAGIGFSSQTGDLTALIALGRGDGTFAAPLELGADRSFSTNGNAALAFDADEDGNLDLVLDSNTGTVILFGDGSGGFARRQDLGSTVGGALSSTSLGSATELLTANFGSTFGAFRCGK